MIDINKLLFEICEDKNVYDDNCELLDSGILDSFAFIELFSRLEDYGIVIYPTRIDKKSLKTPGSIKQLILEYKEKNKNYN